MVAAVAVAAAAAVVEVVDANASDSVAALGLGALVPEDDIDFVVVAVVGGRVFAAAGMPLLSSKFLLQLLLLPLPSRFDDDKESESDVVVTDVSDTTSSVDL